MARVSVADQGIGIAVAEQARVFDRYFRTESGERQADGVGLGLFICRHLIEANQHDSRSMAKYVFVKNREMSWARDHVMRHYPATKIVDDIIDSMRTPF